MPNNLDMGGFGSPGLPVTSNMLGAVTLAAVGSSPSVLFDVNGGFLSQMHVTRLGTIRIRGDSGGLANYASFGGSSQNPVIYRGTALHAMFDQGCTLASTLYYGISSGAPSEGGSDVRLYRHAAGALIQRNGTNAQQSILSRSWTDNSNYSWYRTAWNTSTLLMMAEGAGTGTDGSVAFNDAVLATNATVGFVMLPSCAGTPSGTPADIPTGQCPAVIDSSANRIWIYVGGAWKYATLT